MPPFTPNKMIYFRRPLLSLLFLCFSIVLPLNIYADYEAWLIELEDALSTESVVAAERLLSDIPPEVRSDPLPLLNAVRPHRLLYLEAYYGSLAGKKSLDRAFVEPLLDLIVSSGTPQNDLHTYLYQAGPNSAIGIEAGDYGAIKVRNQALVSLGSEAEVIFERVIMKGNSLLAGTSITPQPSGSPIVACSVTSGQAVLVGCTIRTQEENVTGFSIRAEGEARIAHCRTINCNPGFISWSRAGMLVRNSSALGSGDGRGFVSAFRGVIIAEKCHAENLFHGFESIGDSEMKLKQCVSLKNKEIGYHASMRSRMEVENSFAPQNGRHGFSSVGYAQMITDGCSAEKNGENGFNAYRFASLIATNCHASGNAGSGFASYVAAQMELRRCKARLNKEAGFKAEGPDASIKTRDCESVMNGPKKQGSDVKYKDQTTLSSFLPNSKGP